MVVKLSALCTGRLYSQEIHLVLISVRGCVDPQGHSETGRIMSLKNSNDTITLNSTYIYIKNFLYSGSWILRSGANQPDTFGRSGQANYLVPLQTDIV